MLFSTIEWNNTISWGKSMLLAEKLVYLAIDDTNHQFHEQIDLYKFRKALYGALLMELEFLKKISITSYHITVMDSTPCDRVVLNDILNSIIAEKKEKSPYDWIEWLIDNQPDILIRIRIGMNNRGLLAFQKSESPFGVLSKGKYEIQDPHQKSELHRRIQHLFDQNYPLNNYDRFMIGFAGCCNLLQIYLDFNENSTYSGFLEKIMSSLPIFAGFLK